MTEKKVLLPGPDHPIAIQKAETRFRVVVGEETIADTTSALLLKEASYPAVYYVPRDDVRMDLLERSAHKSYCPYKGNCSYYTIPSGGERSINAVWIYEEPFKAVQSIKDFLPFTPSGSMRCW